MKFPPLFLQDWLSAAAAAGRRAPAGRPDRRCFLQASPPHNASSIPALIYSAAAAALAPFPSNQDGTHNCSWQPQAVPRPSSHSLHLYTCWAGWLRYQGELTWTWIVLLHTNNTLKLVCCKYEKKKILYFPTVLQFPIINQFWPFRPLSVILLISCNHQMNIQSTCGFLSVISVNWISDLSVCWKYANGK